MSGKKKKKKQNNEMTSFPALAKAEPASPAKEMASPAEMAIHEVQELYSLGVRVGFLKRDDAVQDYLAAMKRVYHRAPYLKDVACQGCSCCYSGNSGTE